MFNKKWIYFLTVLFCNVWILNAQTPQDLQRMKSEYEKFQKNQNRNPLLDDGSFKEGLTTNTPTNRNLFPYISSTDLDSIEAVSRYYGYDFFTNRDTVRFWENLPTPPSYYLGPGDELILSMWGETQLRNTYTIDRDGNIYDEKVGILNLMGKSIEDASKYFSDQFGRVYSTLKGPRPSTFINISLGTLKSINVTFVGNVKHPGVHPIHPFSDIIMGLIQAGGIDTSGTLRAVKIKRDNQIIKTVDFYNYFYEGVLIENTQLRDSDVVLVENRISTVIIDSSIVRPGIYESNGKETLYDMINYAGGLKPRSSSMISLERIVKIDDKSKLTTENFYFDYTNDKNQIIKNGDIIMPLGIIPSINKVEIIGQVKRPGSYNYFEGMTLNNLIDLGGGLSDSTYIKSIYLKAAEIVRRDPNTKFEKIIKINLNEILANKQNGEIKLNNLDRFVVRSNYNFFQKENIIISGEVQIPGSYPLMSNNESLKSIILRAGGLTKNALVDGISIFRNTEYLSRYKAQNFTDNNLIPNIQTKNSTNYNLKENEKWIRVAWQNEKVILMPGDSIIIKRSPGTINVSGEVYNPGLIEYQKGKSLRYYLDSAGGVTNNGDKDKIIVIYANGVVRPKKFLQAPRIRDGATIIVNKKEQVDSINFMELATNTLSIISTTVTILVLSQQISSTSN